MQYLLSRHLPKTRLSNDDARLARHSYSKQKHKMANEKDKHKIADYFSLPKLINITQDSGGYSRIELAATGFLIHDAARMKGIQVCLYSGFYYSCIHGDFRGYPAETELSISPLCEEHTARGFFIPARHPAAEMQYDNTELERIVSMLDKTSYKTLKMFAGKSDKLHWDIIAEMGQRNAFIYIRRGIPEKYAAGLLLPFINHNEMCGLVASLMLGGQIT